jgi:hypothetical protein
MLLEIEDCQVIWEVNVALFLSSEIICEDLDGSGLEKELLKLGSSILEVCCAKIC